MRPGHPALIEKRTLFPTTVWDAQDSPRLFIHGRNNRKVGGQVQKGDWAGMPIYTLSLEERATCPEYCATWTLCYGNAMHLARRHAHGPELERRIYTDVKALAKEHPKGFVIRLHVLGDFYSAHYAAKWLCLLFEVPQLHIFGYTARNPVKDRLIFSVIEKMNLQYKDRCFIRLSGPKPIPGGAVVIYENEPIEGAIICPAELIKSECCSTCGLCWAPAARDKAIAFILHGNPGRGGDRKPRIPHHNKGTPMLEAITHLQAEIDVRVRNADALIAQAKGLRDEAREIEGAIAILRKFDRQKAAIEATQRQAEEVQPAKSVEQVAEEFNNAPSQTEVTALPPKPVVEPVDLRKQAWTLEKKAEASKAAKENWARRQQGIQSKGKCPLSVKGNNLMHNGVYLDDLDQDERFLMVDFINYFGFEVLRSEVHGTVKAVDKVVQNLRTVIPRTLEIIDTNTGWKLVAKEA